MLEGVFIAVMMALVWLNTYEIILQEISDRLFINIAALIAYLGHIVLFNLTEHKNHRQELISDRN